MTIRINPHVHSESSYNAHDPVELISEQTAEVGLDVVVVTDHDVIDKSLRAVQLAPMYDLVGIPGVEVSTVDGHLLALGVGELPPRRHPLDEAARWVRERGGAVTVPHPFQRSRHGIGCRRLGQYYDAAGGNAFDAIETHNSWPFTDYKNRHTRRFVTKYQYPGVTGSDVHRVEYVGRAYTETDIPDVSRAPLVADDILTAIRSGSTEVQGRRAPIPTSTRHYAGAAGRRPAYCAERGALGSALLAKKGAFKPGYYAKLGALKSGSPAKTGVAQAARMLYRLSPLSR